MNSKSRIISTDEDPSLRIESSAIINLRGVSTKLNKCNKLCFFHCHIDGNHKVIRWRFVLHGGIDGFSRTIVYLACSDNSRSSTVFSLFVSAANQFHLSRRVWCDHGTENVTVGRHMLRHYGVLRNPVIKGLSVHNQRFERLWKDVNLYIVHYFKNLFYYLESQHLDPVNDAHLLALHLVYKHRINNAITSFIEQWNHHPLRTEINKSPYQLWTKGFYSHLNSNHGTVLDCLQMNEIIRVLAIDDEGPVSDIQTKNNVNVPRIDVDLSEDDFLQLQELVVSHFPNDEHGEQAYRTVCNQIEEILADRANVQ